MGASSQQFCVYLRQFLQPPLILRVGRHAGTRLFSGFGRFEQELPYLARSQTLNEIMKRAVLVSALAAAVLLSAGPELSDIGCSDRTLRRDQTFQQGQPALFQRDCGLSLCVKYLSHIIA